MQFFFLLFTWPYWYIKGMKEYDRLNIKNDFARDLRDELEELQTATSVCNFLEESFDVLHALIRYLSHRTDQKSSSKLVSQWYNVALLIILSIIAFPTAMKYGIRYYDNGCVRSARNHDANCKGKDDHKCNFAW